MTIGNSVASTVSQAGMSMADIPGTKCEKLKKCNDDQREALKSDSKSESIKNYFAGTSTVAHGSLGGQAVVGASSRLLPSRYKHLSKGLWAEKNKAKRKKMRKSGTSNLCPEPAFKYNSAYRPHQSHSESKIVESLFANGPPGAGPLTLNINWQIKDKPTKNTPCRACHRLLCHAKKECKLEIELCQKNPKKPPKPLKCP